MNTMQRAASTVGLSDVEGLRLTARGRRLVVGAAVLLAAAIGFAGGRADAAPALAEGSVVEVAVAQGDTLWAIAGRVTAPGEDRRDVVRRIEQLNGMTSAALVAGDVIAVPAP